MSITIPAFERQPMHSTLGRNQHSVAWTAAGAGNDRSDWLYKELTSPDWLTPTEAAARASRVANDLSKLDTVQHPGIARIEDVSCEHGRLVACRPFVVGSSLADHHQRGGQLTLGGLGSITSDLARALDHLRDNGVRHGSVQENNVILTSKGAVLTDPVFGASARKLAVCGRDATMAQSTEVRDDLSALAVMLYRHATGIDLLRPAAKAAVDYTLPTQVRNALLRAAKLGFKGFDTAEQMARGFSPVQRPQVFQIAWRPAAVIGLFGALSTVGGNSFSDRRDPIAVQEKPRVEAIVEAPKPTFTALPDPSPADRAALRLAVRRRGAAILVVPSVAELFELSDAQRSRIDSRIEAERAKLEALLISAADGSTEVVNRKLEQRRLEVELELLSVLNHAQKDLWTRVTSEPKTEAEPLL